MTKAVAQDEPCRIRRVSVFQHLCSNRLQMLLWCSVKKKMPHFLSGQGLGASFAISWLL